MRSMPKNCVLGGKNVYYQLNKYEITEILNMIDRKKLIVEHTIFPEDFLELRKQVGFQMLSLKQAENVLRHTSYISVVLYMGKAVGMTRLLFDFCTDAYITDVIVLPDYQGCGFGKILLEDTISFIKENVIEGTKIACTLYANKGKEEFYQRFGFEVLPNDKYGYGMILEF